jgi:hypothetical protein
MINQNLDNKMLTIHNETPDGRYYWIVEQTDGMSWRTLGTGYEDTEEGAMAAASSWFTVLTLASQELADSKRFGEAVLFEVEANFLKNGVNNDQMLAASISQALFTISYSLEKGRLHIALFGLGQFLATPENERIGFPFTSDAALVPVYNRIADFIKEPRYGQG